MTLLNLNCHFQDPVFKYIYILRFWGLRTSPYGSGVGIRFRSYQRWSQRGIGEGWGGLRRPCGPGHCSMLAIFICDDCVTQIMVICLPKFPWNTSYWSCFPLTDQPRVQLFPLHDIKTANLYSKLVGFILPCITMFVEIGTRSITACKLLTVQPDN